MTHRGLSGIDRDRAQSGFQNPTEQFIIEFTRLTGKPRLACVTYDRTTGTYKHHPIGRETERAARAMRSHAWAAYLLIRDEA